MGTRSLIGLEQPGGSVAFVYCHWDGYLSHNGKILLRSYSDRQKVDELLSNGGISGLCDEIGEQHPFDWHFDRYTKERDGTATDEDRANWSKWEGWTTFYNRDRGEPLEILAAPHALGFFEYSMGTEYWYLMRLDGTWVVKEYGGEPQLLAEAIAKEEAEEAAAKLQDNAEDLSIT